MKMYQIKQPVLRIYFFFKLDFIYILKKLPRTFKGKFQKK